MHPFSPFGRGLLGLVGALAFTLSLNAQSFQTSFAEQKLDRARTPATLVGPVEVDVPSGAASINIPLGPGIGARGARFTPTLAMRMAPQARVRQKVLRLLLPVKLQDWSYKMWQVDHPELADNEYSHPLEQTEFGGAALNPGTFDLDMEVSGSSESSYEVMGYGGASVQEALPPGFSKDDVSGLLAIFGLNEYTVSQVAKPDAQPPYLRIASNDDLVIGLSKSGSEADPVIQNQFSALHAGGHWSCPRFMAVVRGETAFLFEYLHPMYVHEPVDYIKPDNIPLRGAHYRLVRIANRFNESIRFAYEVSPSIYYSATWVIGNGTGEKTGASVALQLQAQSGNIPIQGTPSLRGGLVSACSVLEVVYTDPANLVTGASLPDYLLTMSETSGGALRGPEVMPPNYKGLDNKSWDRILGLLQPLKVSQGEQFLTFQYGKGPEVTWLPDEHVVPIVLTGLDQPGSNTRLFWEPITFRLNYCVWFYNGLDLNGGLRRIPSFAWGVKSVSITDLNTYQVRRTGFGRKTPQMNWIKGEPEEYLETTEERWVETDFYTQVYHPDGTSTKHIFASPRSSSGAGANGGTLQDLAFLKHVELETIESAPGTPDRVTIHDRMAMFRAGNPDGEMGKSTVPFATRSRTWDGETGVQTLSQTWHYNPNAFGWEKSMTTVGGDSRPTWSWDTFPYNGTGPQSSQFNKTVTTTLEALPKVWLLGRAIGESTTISDPGASASPWTAPQVSRTLNPINNRLEASFTGTLNTTFDFASVTSPSPSGATLTSTGAGVTGVAKASYSYDNLGFLNAISRGTGLGVTLTTRQTTDCLGRAVAQADANGLVTAFSWDGGGRLIGVSPPGETFTSYSIFSDQLGMAIARGAGEDQKTELRYNAFGELVLERRKAMTPGNTEVWSHRIFGYDGRGFRTGETAWLPGTGVERMWAEPNLVSKVTIPSESVQKCDQWAASEDGPPVCLHYITITTPATTIDPLYPGGTVYTYDGRGRVTNKEEPQPDGKVLETKTEYLGLTRRVTVAPSLPEAETTVFGNDALGRLISVTNLGADIASGQDIQTSYGYNSQRKLATVMQIDPFTSKQQLRSWTYDDYGRLSALAQPETPSISFGDFTVLGTPQTKNDNGIVVTTNYDALGRPLMVSSNNLALQTFIYDASAGGLGKLTSSHDVGVDLTYGYSAGTGRLESLTTSVEGQAFTQSFGYNSFGQRTSAIAANAAASPSSAGGQRVDWSYDTARGVPNAAYHNGELVAGAAYYDSSWQLAQLNWAKVASFFDYGSSQSGLRNLVHTMKDASGNAATQGWTYGYDHAGHLLTDGEDSYTYYSLNRLKSATIKLPEAAGAMTQNFSYDAFGNLLKIKTLDAPSSVKANFEWSPTEEALWKYNRLPSSTGASYTPQGHLEQVLVGMGGKPLSMTYDPLGRMRSMLDTERGVTEIYLYTPEGLRTVTEEWLGTVLSKVRINLYNDQRQVVSQWVME